jgi:phosphatidylinositol phospholipase C beta
MYKSEILDEFKLPPCNYENLRKEKAFKLGKKVNKELDTLRKKHLKDRQTMQKNHCTAIEKLAKGKE